MLLVNSDTMNEYIHWLRSLDYMLKVCVWQEHQVIRRNMRRMWTNHFRLNDPNQTILCKVSLFLPLHRKVCTQHRSFRLQEMSRHHKDLMLTYEHVDAPETFPPTTVPTNLDWVWIQELILTTYCYFCAPAYIPCVSLQLLVIEPGKNSRRLTLSTLKQCG